MFTYIFENENWSFLELLFDFLLAVMMEGALDVVSCQILQLPVVAVVHHLKTEEFNHYFVDLLVLELSFQSSRDVLVTEWIECMNWSSVVVECLSINSERLQCFLPFIQDSFLPHLSVVLELVLVWNIFWSCLVNELWFESSYALRRSEEMGFFLLHGISLWKLVWFILREGNLLLDHLTLHIPFYLHFWLHWCLRVLCLHLRCIDISLFLRKLVNDAVKNVFSPCRPILAGSLTGHCHLRFDVPNDLVTCLWAIDAWKLVEYGEFVLFVTHKVARLIMLEECNYLNLSY